MNKASSRLKYNPKSFVSKPIKASSRIKRKLTKNADKNKNNSIILNALKHYFEHLPTLGMAIVLCIATIFFLKEVPPNSVRHFLLPNTYLPFLFLIFLSSLFLLSFVFLNRRVGFLLSLTITTYIFLKVQQVIMEPWLLITLAIAILASPITILIL